MCSLAAEQTARSIQHIEFGVESLFGSVQNLLELKLATDCASSGTAETSGWHAHQLKVDKAVLSYLICELVVASFICAQGGSTAERQPGGRSSVTLPRHVVSNIF